MNDMPITPNTSDRKLAYANAAMALLNLGLVVGNLLLWSDEQLRRNEIRELKRVQQQHSEQINMLMHHGHQPPPQ